MEDPLFLRFTIEHYRALLETKLAETARANLQQLLAEAEGDLARASTRLGLSTSPAHTSISE